MGRMGTRARGMAKGRLRTGVGPCRLLFPAAFPSETLSHSADMGQIYGEQKREYENLEEAAQHGHPDGKAREGQTAQQTRATLLT